MNCNEKSFDEISSLEAYPENAVTFERPFYLDNKKKVSASYFDSEQAIYIPMKRRSATLDEKTEYSRSGDQYSVTLTWKIEDVDNEVFRILEILKNQNVHIIARVFAEGAYFIRSVPDAYRFEYIESEGMIACTMNFQSCSGIQRLG